MIKTRSQRRSAKMRRSLVLVLVTGAGVALVVLLVVWLGEVLS